MARLPRIVIPGQPQHIIQRGNNRQTIFANDDDIQFFRDALVDAADKHALTVHAYVWMTNHVHLLATPARADSISKVFQSVGRRYVQYFSYTSKRSGTRWERHYRATVGDSETYLPTRRRARSKSFGRPQVVLLYACNNARLNEIERRHAVGEMRKVEAGSGIEPL